MSPGLPQCRYLFARENVMKRHWFSWNVGLISSIYDFLPIFLGGFLTIKILIIDLIRGD